jgi:polyisoprenyl-phosphate glycosyltransferase
LKKISIVVACYNEEGNVREMAETLVNEMQKLPQYDYEIIFADNNSEDSTQNILKELAEDNKKIKVIINNRNYGPGRSPRNAFRYVTGDAIISIACDFQDPPEKIKEFIKYWEDGYLAVYGQKTGSKEGIFKYSLRTLYYKIVAAFSDIPQYKHISGICLNDRKVLKQLLDADESIAFRNLIADLGYEVKLIPYKQEKRKSGKSSYNLSRYFNFAINSLVTTSTLPLRIATVVGSVTAFISFLFGMIYLVYKLIYFNSFSAGIAPIVIGIFFLGSIQILFIGLIGEYVGAIHKKLTKTPPVIEKELINLEDLHKLENNKDKSSSHKIG